MSKTKLEYIWLDGYFPTQNMRSKTKVVNKFGGKLEDCPIWSFDGSSTKTSRRRIIRLFVKTSGHFSRSSKKEWIFGNDRSIECRWNTARIQWKSNHR